MLCGFVKTVDIVLEKHVWLVHIIGCEECRSKSNIYLTLQIHHYVIHLSHWVTWMNGMLLYALMTTLEFVLRECVYVSIYD